MPLMGAVTALPAADPRNCAAPNANTPPSAPASQYPSPDRVDASPTIGVLSAVPASEPWKLAPPNAKTPPSGPNAQYPLPFGCAVTPATGTDGSSGTPPYARS